MKQHMRQVMLRLNSTKATINALSRYARLQAADLSLGDAKHNRISTSGTLVS